MSDGETLEEAIENGKDALQCWIEAAAEDGQEIPEPGSSPTWVNRFPPMFIYNSPNVQPQKA